ncbi:IPT/TIG domain-containing protein [Algoriphagus machipongonensis]|uniref:Kelch repeat protein n=1 Tax=Algoriphagus machipongonensis TaxID=388413 RepID=E2RUF1_9BACT|nr:IPT/TIG domain-containing protein [Algoriphagus machipongonensis]EFQ79221.1 putative kelch repeat protein [Algoriphagus machipongonensis]
MQKYLLLYMMILMLGLYSCTEEVSDATALVTEEVLYTSGENVRLLGRLITNQSINVSDHGFYLSEDENFASPIIVSLGEKDGPGRFIGEANGLTNSKTYFAKAFMELGGETQFGNVIELETLSPKLGDFTPSFGQVGQEMVIVGQNFTEDTRVFFGENEANITGIDFESRIHLIIPNPSKMTVPLKVMVQDTMLEFETSFEYQIGTYEIISSFPEAVRLYGTAFYSIGNGLNIGLGTISKNSFYSKIQRFEIGSGTWDEVDFPGSPRAFAFATSNFLGGGTADLTPNPYDINRSFYRVKTNGFERLPDLNFDSRESIAFEYMGNLYVLGGKEGNPNAVRLYNASSGSWTSLPDSPIALSTEYAFFNYEDKLFVIDDEKKVWEYLIPSNSWNIVSNFPGSLGQGYGVGEVLGEKAYVGLYNRGTELWEFDLNSFKWKPKNDIPGTPSDVTVAHFSTGGYIYFMRMPDISIAGNYPMNLFKFDPNGF